MSEHRIVRTVQELAALDPETLVIDSDNKRWLVGDASFPGFRGPALDWHHTFIKSLPAVIVATGEQVRAARTALQEASHE